MSGKIFEFLQTIDTPFYGNPEGSARIADKIDMHRFDHEPEVEGCRVAIVGVNDGRNSGDNEGCSGGPEAIRNHLYRLTPHTRWAPVADLGDIRTSFSEDETEAALIAIVAELVQM